MSYWLSFLIALDQLANALIGGWPDETISARAWRCRQLWPWGVAYRVINALFFWQPNHCRGAYAQELRRRHLPPEARDISPAQCGADRF